MAQGGTGGRRTPNGGPVRARVRCRSTRSPEVLAWRIRAYPVRCLGPDL